MIILLWISRLTTSVYTTRGIYALVLDLQREDKVWPRFPSVAGSSWFFPSGQLGSRQSGEQFYAPTQEVNSMFWLRIVSWYYPTLLYVPLVTKYLFRLIPQEPSTWLPLWLYRPHLCGFWSGLCPGMLFYCDISHTRDCHLCNSKLLVCYLHLADERLSGNAVRPIYVMVRRKLKVNRLRADCFWLSVML